MTGGAFTGSSAPPAASNSCPIRSQVDAPHRREPPGHLRVLQTPPRYAPFVGGVEKVSQMLSERLVKAGDDVTVICADEPRGSGSVMNQVRIKRLRWLFKVANTNITPGLPLALVRGDWDLVHTHLPTPWSADWSCIVGRIRRKRVILTFYNEIVGEGWAGLVAWVYRKTLLRLTFRLAHVILLQSEPWRERLSADRPHLASKLYVLPNGIDIDRFRPSEGSKRPSSDLLFVSVLDAFHGYKGLSVLLKALAQSKKGRLRVVGDGSMRAAYETQANELGISNRVEFLGAISDEALLEQYQSARVFVLPSMAPRHEGGSSLVVLEAMSCGLPVIVAEGAGQIAWEAEAAGAGIRVRANDVDELENAIRRLLDDDSLRLSTGARAREHVLAHGSWDVIVPRIRALYEA